MPKVEPPNEDEVKRAAELREWLESRISEVEMELLKLRDMQLVVDSVLRRTSFVPATELKSKPASKEKPVEPIQRTQTVPVSPEEPRQLRRQKDGMLIASAFVSSDKVVIVPSSDVRISQTIPPFQTFFVNRILKGYESKDQELVASGKLNQAEALSYNIEESDGNISKLTVKNYRDKARLNEILSTINWAFTRMLEKK